VSLGWLVEDAEPLASDSVSCASGFLRLILTTCRSRRAVEAENLFLRKQLALFQERKTRPRRADDFTRWLMSFLSRWFDWRNALVVVKPETLIRWHRRGFRLFWRWKSRPVGRPRLPKDIQALIRQMARENPIWGEEHIANELRLKLGIQVSPRTVGKYLVRSSRRMPDPGQRWLTDFFVVVTARFRILYVFVLMELGRRRILHVNVTDHPSADWTQQQLREALPGDHPFRFLIHGRDSIFSQELDQMRSRHGSARAADAAASAPSKCCLRTPSRNDPPGVCGFPHSAGTANLKRILNRWVRHYNHARVHMSLGPGTPAPLYPSPPQNRPSTPASAGPLSAPQSCAGRTASRILVGKKRGMNTYAILADHNVSSLGTDNSGARPPTS
jgi:putative transposase